MSNPLGFSDRARRCSDAVNLQLTIHGFNANGRWVAIRMSDGGSDGVLYDTRADAIRHQFTETQCCYVQVPPTGMPVGEAESYLAFNEMLYDNGHRIIDPDSPTIHMPQTFVIPRGTHR